MDLADGDLVALAQAGDRDAVQQLLERHERRVLAAIVGMVRNPDDAREILKLKGKNNVNF